MSNTFLRLSVLFVVLGVSLGYWMGATHNFIVSPVHAHINLLGWVSMFLYGLFYRVFPEAAQGWLPKAHIGARRDRPAGHDDRPDDPAAGVASLMSIVPVLMIAGPTMIVLGMMRSSPSSSSGATGGKDAVAA